MLNTLTATWRFFRDPRASLGIKLLFVFAVFYLVFPFDVVPDVLPFVGWLDDLGLVAIATTFLFKAVGPYKAQEGVGARGTIETEGVEVS